MRAMTAQPGLEMFSLIGRQIGGENAPSEEWPAFRSAVHPTFPDFETRKCWQYFFGVLELQGKLLGTAADFVRSYSVRKQNGFVAQGFHGLLEVVGAFGFKRDLNFLWNVAPAFRSRARDDVDVDGCVLEVRPAEFGSCEELFEITEPRVRVNAWLALRVHEIGLASLFSIGEERFCYEMAAR